MGTWSSHALAAVAIAVCGVAAAQPSITVAELGVAAPTDVAGNAALTRADLEPWLDGFLPYALRQGDIAGGVIVVVQDGEVLLQKGYGLADVEKGTPVDPQRTLFRLGSVAKLFTWTAVMQLVERGKLDLDRDINTYLDFAIPRTFDQPITLRHIMTHTPGFEEMLKRLIADDPRQFLPLEAYVKAQMPARIYPPGTVPAYSNYGTALAGYIVQRVSGESFDDYVERQVFGPLEMHSSTFRQPLPARFAAQMSRGYLAASDPARYFELVGPAPAGALAASGADMARFMIACQQVRSGAAPALLQPQTARLMQETMFRAAPPSNGMALGFFERSRNGRRIIGHAAECIANLGRGDPNRHVDVTIHPELVAHADPELLRVAMTHLIENAWKFTRDAAQPRIEIGVEARHNRAAAFVRDNGVGFDPAYVERLFTPFRRLHSPREFSGTGIGLAIVQRVIQRHGGQIWAESRPGQGATFYFTLAGA